MGFDSLRRKVDEVADSLHGDREFMCQARDYPSEWSVKTEEHRLCTHHAFKQPHEWPPITDKLLQLQAQGRLPTFASAARRIPPSAGGWMSDDDKLRAINEIRAMLHNSQAKDPKAWARRLRDREEAGEKLSKIQKAYWREALRSHDDA